MNYRHFLILFFVIFYIPIRAEVIVNGVPWYDENMTPVNAHGACIIEENGKYWLFGEWKSDKSNAFPGFSCYSSDDLSNWKFEKVVLGVQPDGILGPNRVGERCKVMKCPKTGEYVMLMHCDNMFYKDPYIGIATSPTINGEYTFRGPLLFDGKPINKWDMGTFQDTDGSGYLLIHHGPIYKLSDDYRSVVEQVANVPESGESPAMFKKDGIYYLLYSNLTSWEKNDNFYFSAPSISGPWTKQGLFCPEGKLTYNSQSTFVFPLKKGDDIVPMFMGDRWSYPLQASAATYVWLPLQVEGTKISIPEFWQAWNPKDCKPVDILSNTKKTPLNEINHSLLWKESSEGLKCNAKGSTISIPFHGKKVAIEGESNPHGGYARVSINDKKGKEIFSSVIDFYSYYPEKAIRIITPELPVDDYILKVEATGISPIWDNKRGNIYGSDDTEVTITNIYLF